MGPKRKDDTTGLTVAEALLESMARVEVFEPNTRAWRNRNPLNVWDGLAPGKAKRIWPSIPIDAEGFLIFATVAEGRALTLKQLERKINRGLNLRQLVAEWAPASDPRNRPGVYAARVAKHLSIDLETPLASMVGRIGGWK